MKKYLKTSLVWTTLCLLLTTSALAEQPAQPQDGVTDIITGSHRITFSAEALAAMKEAGHLNHGAAVALHAGNYAEAEATVRQSIALWPTNSGVPEEILARVLDAQGKRQEAIQLYQSLSADQQAHHLLPYALLLLKSGQWPQAVAIYNQARPSLGQRGVEQTRSSFFSNTPEPKALAVAIHIEMGQLFNSASDWAGEPQSTEAMAEYGKALQLAPSSDLANYYYGIGWQKLSPAERAKMGSIQQAKAALQKAVLLDRGMSKKPPHKR